MRWATYWLGFQKRIGSLGHHLLPCGTPTKALCCPDPELGVASWNRLKQLVRELGLEDPARPQGIVLRTKADCLRICAEGPILLIWPDGVIYGGVTAERIERILREHLIGGVPIETCVVFQTRKPVTANFWTNVNDARFAIPGVIEMSNLRPLQGHIVYVPFYIPADHPDYQRPNQAFIDDAWACLRAINPQLSDADLLDSHCSRYRFAQPVCGVHFQQSLPPLQPFPGVFTADTTAYYPEDRGISESIDFGRKLARQAVEVERCQTSLDA